MKVFKLVNSFIILLLFIAVSSSCSQNHGLARISVSAKTVSTPAVINTPHGQPGVSVARSADESNYILGLTHQSPDGNRFIDGAGGSLGEPLDIQLDGIPLWIVAVPYNETSVWYVILENGHVQAFQVNGNIVQPLAPTIELLPLAIPPVLVTEGNQPYLSLALLDEAVISSPIVLQDDTRAYIAPAGELVINHSGQQYALPVGALPDARVLSDEAGRLLFLSHPTQSYQHGVLGDDLEAASITLVHNTADPAEVTEIKIDEDDVIEGIAPIWVDIDLDGSREIIVTQSNSIEGARLVVYREDGTLFAEGEPVGNGYRWIHQIAAAQFIQGGPLEIMAIRTPHIGGVVELYQLNGNRLEVVDTLAGYSSHQIGSRNLDSALAADFNGDGLVELLIPDQTQLYLSGIQFDGKKLAPVWELQLEAKLSSNLVMVKSSEGQLTLGAGTENQLLRLWHSVE